MNALETERLVLRSWKEEDVEPYYEMNQDSKVLEFLRGPLSREEVKKFIADKNETLAENGYTLWAVENKKTETLLGFVGLQEVLPLFPFAPAIEIGWRLAFSYWGKGYATEAAQTVVEYGFNKLNLEEIVSYTVAANHRSQRVMEKIGMKCDLVGDFLHPRLPPKHPLAPHVLYRLRKDAWNPVE